MFCIQVTLKTTVGDLDIELWPKEAPKAVRNFVQLCLEGYYDGVIFHRVIKDFMAQTGDPTGTGEGASAAAAAVTLQCTPLPCSSRSSSRRSSISTRSSSLDVSGAMVAVHVQHASFLQA